MAEQLLVHFTTAGPDADRRLVREYVLDAVDRLRAHRGCDGVGFVPAGQKPGVGGLVLLGVAGDVDAVVESERERWDSLVEQGKAEGWTTETVDPAAEWGEAGAALRVRLETLAARLSRLVYEELDAPPDPVDAHPEEATERTAPTGVGWWTLLHLLTLQRGYAYDDEIEAYTEGVRGALYRTAQYEGIDAATDRVDDVIASLRDVRDDVEDLAA